MNPRTLSIILITISALTLRAEEPTAAQREQIRITTGEITSQIRQLRAHLPASHARLMQLWWEPGSGVTTQQLADAMGSDAQQLYLLGGALQRFLDLLEPGNEQLLQQFASAPRPEIKAPTRQPLAETTWDQQGRATIVPFPELDPEEE